MNAFLQDLRYGFRLLSKKPLFTAIAVLTLAIGIGGNIAVYSVVHAVLLQRLPFRDSDQLVRVYDDLRGSNARDVSMSVPEMWDFQQRAGFFQDLAGIFPTDADLTGGDHPERVELLGTSPNYFTMLGAKPQLGQIYTPQGGTTGFSGEVVISNGLWRRDFGGDPNVVGKQLRLDNDLYTIVGVMPSDFRHPGPTIESNIDAWVSAGFAAPPFAEVPQRAVRVIPGAIARLKPGVTISQAQAQLDAFAAHLKQEFPSDYPAAEGWSLRLVSVQDALVGDVRTELLVLLGAVAFVLLIGCANLATFFLARVAGRQSEIAIRLTMGAPRSRLIRQLLTESMLLATMAAGVALAVMFGLKSWLLTLAPSNLPRLSEVTLSGNVVFFAFAVSILTGLLFGLAPALQAARSSQVSSLREGSSRSGSSLRQARLSRILVVSEIALSLVLLIGAGLLVRSFRALLQQSPGFDPKGIVTARIWMPVPNDPKANPYLTIEARTAFLQEVLRRVSALPGTKGAAIGSTSSLPMGPLRNRLAFTIEDRPAASQEVPVAERATVTPEVFRILRIPLISGRYFTDADDNKNTKVAIIDQTLAQRYWPNESAAGHRIQFPSATTQYGSAAPGWATIVGVVGNVKSEGLDASLVPHIYLPEYQGGNADLILYLQTVASSGALSESIRHEVQAVDSSMPVFGVHTMIEVVAQSMAERRFALELIGIFAAVALLLASFGVYGVMAYFVTQRTREIGIRIALGAQSSDIFRMTIGEGMILVIAGVITGSIGAAALAQFLRSMLFGITATDPVTFIAIPALLASIAFLACYIPARRATRVDPLVALREN